MRDTKDYFHLIEHNYNPGILDQMYQVVKPMTAAAFPNQVRKGVENLDTGGTNFNISTHLSQYDWLIHQMVAYEEGRRMAISCGDNLNLPIMGKVLRNLGAFIHFRKENKSNVVPEDIRKDLWPSYVRSLVAEGKYDILAFVGKAPGPDGNLKLGRPYDGSFGEFPLGSLGLIQKTVRAAVKPAYVIPSNITYRRVNEDLQVQRLARMKDRKWSSAAVYLYDFLHIATGMLFRKASDFTVQYGEPIHIQETRGKDIWRLANLSAAQNQTVYDTHLVASALSKKYSLKDIVGEVKERRIQKLKFLKEKKDLDPENPDFEQKISSIDEQLRTIEKEAKPIPPIEYDPADITSLLDEQRDLFAAAGMNVDPVDKSNDDIVEGFESQLSVAVKRGKIIEPELIDYYANQVDTALDMIRKIRD